ncbi:MAG: response regulator [Campylobacterales bacterium]|nr:response regulator [Campylobacterales bacterium]
MREYLKEFTLLYAEDESQVQTKMAEYFETFFKKVYCASNGQEALELHQQYLPDVVILDINMPKINGLEVAQRIRKKNSRAKIIMLIAHSEKEFLLQATEIDMSKYLIKPVSPYDLKLVLNKVASELILTSNKFIKLSEDVTYFIENDTLISKVNEIDLSPKEQKLLSLLVQKRGTCVTFEDITFQLSLLVLVLTMSLLAIAATSAMQQLPLLTVRLI